MIKLSLKSLLTVICLVSVIIFIAQLLIISTVPINPSFYVNDQGRLAPSDFISYVHTMVRRGLFSRKSVKPRRITYITVGEKPTWKEKLRDNVIRVRKPEVDPQLAYYTHKDIVHFNDVFRQIKQTIPKNFFSLNISDLLDIREKFHRKTQSNLLEWAEVTKFSPMLQYSMRDRFYHVNLLRTKVDPDGQQIKCNGCFKQSFNTLISPERVCSGSKPIDLFGIVTTVPNAFTERQAIRDTWGKWTKDNTANFRLIFLIGGGWSNDMNQKLRWEHKQFGDLLQEDYKDSYYNLTYKVISGMNWVVRRCPRAKFIMRSAGDSFVHIPSVMDLLYTFGREPAFRDYQIGRCLFGQRPYRWLDYKGFVSNMEYALDSFPPYALGTNYLTSMNLTRDILAKVPDTPYMSIEDSYFGIVLWQMGRGCHDIEGFIQNDYIEKVSMTDIERWPYFAQHPVTPEQMYMLYQKSLLYRKRDFV